jgi:hypothetical protein
MCSARGRSGGIPPRLLRTKARRVTAKGPRTAISRHRRAIAVAAPGLSGREPPEMRGIGLRARGRPDSVGRVGIFATVFGGRSGVFPEAVRQRLEVDGLLLIEEKVAGTVTYRNYRGPEGNANVRKEGKVWAMAATARGLVVMSGGRPMVDVGWNAPQFAALAPSVDDGGRFLLAFDAGRFRRTASGTIEVRCRSAQPQQWVDLVLSRRRRR